MDIIEGNKLIAEFMGYRFNAYTELQHHNITAPGESEWYFATWVLDDFNEHIITDIAYHLSWDRLMPVVEKISRITIEWENSDDRTDTYYPRTFGMLNEVTGRPMVRINSNILFEADTLIEATWLAVTDFIKYYTEKNDKN